MAALSKIPPKISPSFCVCIFARAARVVVGRKNQDKRAEKIKCMRTIVCLVNNGKCWLMWVRDVGSQTTLVPRVCVLGAGPERYFHNITFHFSCFRTETPNSLYLSCVCVFLFIVYVTIRLVYFYTCIHFILILPTRRGRQVKSRCSVELFLFNFSGNFHLLWEKVLYAVNCSKPHWPGSNRTKLNKYIYSSTKWTWAQTRRQMT